MRLESNAPTVRCGERVGLAMGVSRNEPLHKLHTGEKRKYPLHESVLPKSCGGSRVYLRRERSRGMFDNGLKAKENLHTL